MSTPSTSETTTPQKAFVDHLTKLERRAREQGDGDARARLARLRRCITRQGASLNALREVGTFLPENLSDEDMDTYLLVAALFAHHLKSGKGKSLGVVLHNLRTPVGAKGLDRRFATLIESDREDLPYRLRQLFQLLKSKEVPVDYQILLEHLLAWDHPERWVQRRWARDYWTS